MRKLVNISAAATVALQCVLYYAVYLLLLLSGMRETPALIVSIALLFVIYSPMLKAVSEFIEKNRIRNAVICFALSAVLFAVLTVIFKQMNLVEALVSSAIEMILYGVLVPVIPHLIFTITYNKSIEKTAQKIKDSDESLVVNLVRDANEGAQCGENKTVSEEYDEKLSVKCDNGIFIGTQEKNVLSFKGIPYAKQPVGNLRWKKPERMENSEKVFEAKHFGKISPQPQNRLVNIDNEFMGEDCLNLNIWKKTTSKEPRNGCPVLVHFYSLDPIYGGCSTPMLAGDELVKKYPEVIYVSVNYRLGLFANVDFSGIQGGEEYSDSTCLELLDQIEALHWIRRNIRKFGGDRENITVIGELGGASAILTLCVMPKAKGLFHRAIMLGATSFHSFSKEHGRCAFELFREEANAATMEDFLHLSSEEIVEITKKIRHKAYIGPIRDGINVPENIFKEYQNGMASDINILFGKSADELSMVSDFIEKGENYVDFLNDGIDPDMPLTTEEYECYERYREKFMSEQITDEESARYYEHIVSEVPVYVLSKAQAKAEGTVRFMYWKPKNTEEWLKAQSILMPLILLDKIKGNEKFSVLGDPIGQSFIQQSTINFMKYGNPSIESGDYDGMTAVDIPKFNELEDKIIVVDHEGGHPIGDEMLGIIKDLEPLADYIFKY